jgi:hypothetical protein
MRRVGAYLV